MKHFHIFLIAGMVTVGSTRAEIDTDALPKVEDGFEIGFFVKEPHIINPSSLCFDKRGRLFVGAGPQYRLPEEDSPTDYIKILIDEDGDGVAETVKTFAEGLNCVESMAWRGDELWVANSPDLTVLRDTDGDDVADEYEIIYSGLNNLRHALHGLNWGPDGWLYMTIGNTWVSKQAPKPFLDLQGQKVSEYSDYPVNEVYTRETYKKGYHSMKKDEKEGGIFRCRPGGHDLELFARGMRNPFDMCMDSGFNWLATDNDPGPPADRIFMPVRHGHYGFRHPWKFDWMGAHPAVAPSSDLFPSVSGSGTGVVFYNADHFPEKYQDRYLIADWTNNCIFLYEPKWEGALQVPAGEKRKIVESSGGYGDLEWKGGEGRSLFRPTDMEIGPDGAVYIAGWGSDYGTVYVPKEKWTEEESAKYQGRVFRLTHKDPLIPDKQWDGPKRSKSLSEWTPAELLEDLNQPLHVWRVDAQDELVRRGAAVRDDLLKAVLSGGISETQATWAIWAVGRIDKATGGDHSDFEKIARNSENLNLRIQAVRILGENKVSTATPLLVELLSDPEPRIRLATMQSLDLVGWDGSEQIIIDAVANESDRLVLYTNWQVMRRQLPAEERRKLLDDPRFLVRQMAALGLMEDGDRDLQGRADDYLKDSGKTPGKAKPEENIAPATTVLIRASEGNFREKTTVSFETVTSGYAGPAPAAKPEAESLRVDLGSSENAKVQDGWQEWNFTETAGLIKQSKSFPFDNAVGGKLAATLITSVSGIGRNYGLSNVTDSSKLAIPDVWSDQVFFNNDKSGSLTLLLENLTPGTYRFASYSYANNLSAVSDDESTAHIHVNGVMTPLTVTMIAGGQSSLADGDVDSDVLGQFGTATFQFSVARAGDSIAIHYGKLSAGDTFGLNGFELARISEKPTTIGNFDIRYTLDGSTPKASSAKAAKELTITKDTIIKTGAFNGKQLVSEIATLGLHRITDSEWKDRLFVQALSRDGYEVVNDGLQRGVLAYSDDSSETISAVPDAIAGTTLIRTRKEDGGITDADFLSFELNLPATVLVAFDQTAKLPAWLSEGWEKTEHGIATSKGNRLLVYRKDVEPGSLTLGGNQGATAMYQIYLSKKSARMTTAAAVTPLLAKADLKRGEEIFFGRGTCFACHQVKGRGVVVGPELVAINQRRDNDYIIESILQPDVYIVEGFQQTSLELKDGRKLFGMILEETGLQISIVLPTGEKVDVPTDDLKKRDDAEHSGMPGSFGYTMSPQDVADVTAWIMGLK